MFRGASNMPGFSVIERRSTACQSFFLSLGLTKTPKIFMVRFVRWLEARLCEKMQRPVANLLQDAEWQQLMSWLQRRPRKVVFFSIYEVLHYYRLVSFRFSLVFCRTQSFLVVLKVEQALSLQKAGRVYQYVSYQKLVLVGQAQGWTNRATFGLCLRESMQRWGWNDVVGQVAHLLKPLWLGTFLSTYSIAERGPSAGCPCRAWANHLVRAGTHD